MYYFSDSNYGKNLKNFKIETAHNRFWICLEGNNFEIRGHDKSLQSQLDLSQSQRLMMQNLEHLMSVLLFIPPPNRVLLLGIGGGSLIHYLRFYLPRTALDALDIDAELVEKMLELGVLPRPGDGLSYIYDDAAAYLDRCNQRYDLVLVDIFSGAQSPRWLRQKETCERLYRLLGENGALACNLLIDSETEFKRFYRNLRLACGGKTLCMPVQDYANIIAFGLRAEPPPRDMNAWLEHASELSTEYDIDFVKILSVIYNTNPVGGGVL